MAQMGSYAITTRAASSVPTPWRSRRTWPATLSSVAPASRSPRLSPTQRIGTMAWEKTARTFLFTTSSVSPNS